MYFAATTLYCYDYLLTFDREVKYFWRGGMSLATALFFAYRYAGLLNTIPELLGLIPGPWLSQQSCRIILRVIMCFDIIVLVSTTIFAALRVYAIYGRNRLAFGVVLASGLINPCILIVRYYTCVSLLIPLAHLTQYIFTRSNVVFSEIKDFQACTLGILGGVQSYEKYVATSLCLALYLSELLRYT